MANLNTRTPRYSTRRSRCMAHVPDSVKRNLNNSFCENDSPKMIKSPKKDDLTIVINKKDRTSRYKNFYYESVSESENDSDDPKKLIINGKRKVKQPQKFEHDDYIVTTPVKSPRKNHNQNHVHVSGKSDIKQQSKQKANYYYCESISESENSDSNDSQKLIISEKRKVKPPRKYFRSDDDDDYKSENENIKKCVKTPSRKTTTISKSTTPRTPALQKIISKDLYSIKKTNSPRLIIKLIRNGEITPSIPLRQRPIKLNSTPLSEARRHLQVSFVPTQLPCREKEYSDVLGFLKGKLVDRCGGCIYISGVPGTGKTATVTAVVNHLLELSSKHLIPEFKFISINGMKLSEPRQAYVEILKQLTDGKTVVVWEQAQNMLNDKFTKLKKKGQLTMPLILLIDELDILCTKRQDVIYNLLDWPTKSTQQQLIVITIANTMDLPERMLMNRVTSRLGLTRLTFQAYTHKQLQEIVTRRLLSIGNNYSNNNQKQKTFVDDNVFNSDAIQLVARKVASVSGDARRALDICRKAVEIAENGNADDNEDEIINSVVTIHNVNEAIKQMMTNPKVQAIKHCSRLEQYVLQSIVAEMERTGIEETNFSYIYTTLLSLFALNGIEQVSSTTVLQSIARLNACRLLLVDSKCNDLVQRVILNVSPDDVFYALKEE